MTLIRKAPKLPEGLCYIIGVICCSACREAIHFFQSTDKLYPMCPHCGGRFGFVIGKIHEAEKE